MYKVLIVDDDTLIRQHIKSYLNWEEYEFEIIGEESDGANALEFIKNNSIDLVITDISMPLMDGVELIKTVKQQYAEIEFLVFSNFDDFNYVKDAMKYGAIDYLLKFEIDAQNLASVLKSIKSKLKNDRENSFNRRGGLENKWKEMLIEQYWKKILLGYSGGEAINSEALSLGMEINSGSYVLLLADIENGMNKNLTPNDPWEKLPERFTQAVSGLTEVCKYSFTINISDNRWVIILRFREKGYGFIKNSSSEIANNIIKTVKQAFGLIMTIAVSEAIYKMSEFPSYYKAVEACIQSKFFWNFGKVIDSSFFNGLKTEFNSKLMYDMQKQLTECIKNMEFDAVSSHTHALFKEINKEKYVPELVYDYFTGIVLSIKNVLEEKALIQQSDCGIKFFTNKEIMLFATLQDIRIWFTDFMEQIKKIVTDNSNNSARKEVKKAIALIRENYRKDLTLDYVAEYAGVSRNYFCTLFKEEVGISFIEYLNKYRIEKANILITNSNKSMKEVAAAVGLNYGYFCRVYKGFTGQRPSQTRE